MIGAGEREGRKEASFDMCCTTQLIDMIIMLCNVQSQ